MQMKYPLGRGNVLCYFLLLEERSLGQCCCSWNKSPFGKQVPGCLFQATDCEQLPSWCSVEEPQSIILTSGGSAVEK